jgi:hypothetical protein
MNITNCKWTLHDGNKWTPQNWKFLGLINDSIEKKELKECQVRRLCRAQHRCFGRQRFINGFFIKQKITALKHIVVKLNLLMYCLCCVGHEIVGKERVGRRIHLQMVTSHKLQQLLLSVPILLLCTGRNSSCAEVQPFKKTRWSL